jgi:hypothetical protein
MTEFTIPSAHGSFRWFEMLVAHSPILLALWIHGQVLTHAIEFLPFPFPLAMLGVQCLLSACAVAAFIAPLLWSNRSGLWILAFLVSPILSPALFFWTGDKRNPPQLQPVTEVIGAHA